MKTEPKRVPGIFIAPTTAGKRGTLMAETLEAIVKAALDDSTPTFKVAIGSKHLDNLIAYVKRTLAKRRLPFVYYPDSKRLLLGGTAIEFEAIN